MISSEINVNKLNADEKEKKEALNKQKKHQWPGHLLNHGFFFHFVLLHLSLSLLQQNASINSKILKHLIYD